MKLVIPTITGMVLFLLFSPVMQASQSVDEALIHWARVLDQFVDQEGRTDFEGLSKNRRDLENYIEFVRQISPASNPELFPTPSQVLAYHINTYNALAMYGVIEAGIPDDFNSFFKRAAFFKFRGIIVGGKKTSLYDYENKVIRPLGEARVHFALNCMVRDCPRLPREPFYPESLDMQLETVTKDFFSEDRNFYLEADKRQLWLSEILDFYTEDFIGSNDVSVLIDYVNQYIEEPVPADFRVRFIKYDWTINRQPAVPLRK